MEELIPGVGVKSRAQHAGRDFSRKTAPRTKKSSEREGTQGPSTPCVGSLRSPTHSARDDSREVTSGLIVESGHEGTRGEFFRTSKPLAYLLAIELQRVRERFARPRGKTFGPANPTGGLHHHE